MVASVPYDQSIRFVSQPRHSGWGHDLGVESALWTAHPAISTNGWSRGESDFVDYTASLLRTHDPAFTALLGSAGVKYLIKFDYAPSAPHLLARAGDDPLYQQHSVETMMPGRSWVQETAGGALYTLPGASPILSFRPNIAVILGGRAGLAAFTDLPGIHPADWATFAADDLLTGSNGSFSRLIRYLRTADLVLVTGDTEQDLAVLATRPLVRVPGVTSDPGLDRKLGLLLTDESARRGSLADQTIPPPALVTTSTRSFSLDRPSRLELWTRVLFTGKPGLVRFFVDGRPVDTLLPLAPGEGGFRWIRVMSKDFAPGHHHIRVEGEASELGTTFEVDETRLLDPVIRTRILSALVKELLANRQNLAYSLDLSTAQYANLGTVTRTAGFTGYPLDRETSSFWQATSSTGITSSEIRDRGRAFQRFQLGVQRPYYAFAYHAFQAPQSWQGRDALLLRYRGTGSGSRYNFLVDFTEDHTKFASFPIIDDKPGWQAAVIRIAGRSRDWRHVVSVRLATKDKIAVGQLDLGPIRWLFPQEVVVTRDLATSELQKPHITGVGTFQGATTETAEGPASVTTLRAVIPIPLSYKPLRLVALPNRAVSPMPATAVKATSEGTAEYNVAFAAPRRGVLVFNQAYDPHWRLKTNGLELRPTARIESLTNGFLIPAGRYSGTVTFADRRLPTLGTALAVIASIGLAIALLLASAKKRRSLGGGARVQDTDYQEADQTKARASDGFGRGRPGLWAMIAVAITIGLVGQFSFLVGAAILVILAVTLRISWDMPLRLALILMGLAPLCIATGHWELADVLALFAIFLITISLALVIGKDRLRLRPEQE